MAEPITLEQVRTRWGAFLERVETGTEPTLVQPAGQDTPSLAALPPALYDTYRTALKLPPAEPRELKRISTTDYRVDWTDVPTDILISLDSKAARSQWAEIHLRIKRGQHVIVILRYPGPGRRAAVLVPPAFVEQATKALAK